MGPMNQLKKMFDSTRLIATIVFLVSSNIGSSILFILFFRIEVIGGDDAGIRSCCKSFSDKEPIFILPFLDQNRHSRSDIRDCSISCSGQ